MTFSPEPRSGEGENKSFCPTKDHKNEVVPSQNGQKPYSCFSSFGDFYDLKVKIAVFSCLDENLVAGEQSKSIVALLVTRATILLSPC